MKKFLIALQFLTILPIRIKELKEEDIGASLIYFPVIGVFIGLFLVLILFAFDFLPHLVRITLVLIGSIIITGGIHLDGFADTCDGFCGSKPRERTLEIMRDSRVGVMGVTGIVSILLLKFALMASFSQDILWRVLILMPVFSRWAQIFACYASVYARSEGKAKYFVKYAGRREFIIGTLFTIVLFLFLMQVQGVALLFFSMLPICLFINYVKRRIGGMTGDTIGATNEIAEVVVLFSALSYSHFHI